MQLSTIFQLGVLIFNVKIIMTVQRSDWSSNMKCLKCFDLAFKKISLEKVVLWICRKLWKTQLISYKNYHWIKNHRMCNEIKVIISCVIIYNTLISYTSFLSCICWFTRAWPW